ncbi:leucine-rich repeat domain-containing protein [Sutcliffiella horikoshii]|uniref:leucine-rich repeat domain-containing protein n=1 Tax=Sutcliffiella horikoshii TaxID=79883 RepID=UPI00384D2374
MKAFSSKFINLIAIFTLVISLFSPAIARAETVTKEETEQTSLTILQATEKDEGTTLTLQAITPEGETLTSFTLVKNGVEQNITPELLVEETLEGFTNRTYTYIDTTVVPEQKIHYAISATNNETLLFSNTFFYETKAQPVEEEPEQEEQPEKPEQEEPPTEPKEEQPSEPEQPYNESNEQPAQPNIQQQIVNVPDENLLNQLKASLDITNENIYVSDMERLTYFSASGSNITDITGLEYAVNLQELSIYNNNITDISPLENLTNLTYLDIEINNIQDITPLAKLTQLETLWLSANPVADISTLSNLVNLRTLYLHDTSITSINVLSDLQQLTYVSLNRTPELDKSEGSEASAVITELRNRGVDVDSGEFQENYVWIDHEYSTEESIRVYYAYTGETPSVYEIYVNGTLLTTTEDTAYLITGLQPDTEYEIKVVALQDGEALSSATAYYSTRSLPSGDVIEYAEPALEQVVKNSLGIGDRQVYQSDMEYLWFIEASYLELKDLSGLEYATNLEYLYLDGNQISDLTPLSNLDSLLDLTLRNNQITDLSPLASSNLNWLDVENNPISDISVLLTLENLTSVNVRNLDSLTFEEGTPEMTVVQELLDRGIDVYYGDHEETYYELELYADEITADSVLVSWHEDGNVEAAYYEIYLNGELLDTFSNQSTYLIEGLSDDRGYEILLEAYDGNSSHLAGSGIIVYPSSDGGGDEDEGEGEGEPVAFEDANLEEAIRNNIQIYNRQITSGDLEKAEYLNISGYDITSLEGLQFATNLKALNADHNNIKDVSPLADLTQMTDLVLWNNQITDISSLEKLTNLTFLDLDTNNVSDISALENMEQLEILWLKDNPVTDISLLLQLPSLTDLYLEGINVDFSEGTEGYEIVQTLIENGVSVSYYSGGHEPEFMGYINYTSSTSIGVDWTTTIPHEEIDRVELAVSGGEPFTLSPEENYYEITGLEPNTTYTITFRLVTVDGVDYTHQLEASTTDQSNEFRMDLISMETTADSVQFSWETSVYAGFNIYLDDVLYGDTWNNTYQITGLNEGQEYKIRIDALDEAENVLGDLTFWVTPYGDEDEGEGSPIIIEDANLENKIREILNIHHRDLTTGDMEEIESLYAGELNISSLEGLQYASNLAYLDVQFNEITDVTPLKDLTSLINLEIWGNSNLTDISALANLTNLTYLDMDQTGITDISPLKDMDNLETLYMSNTYVTDISALLELDALVTVYMYAIPADLSEGTPAYEVIQALEAKGVSVNYDQMEEEKGLTAVTSMVTQDTIGIEWWTTNIATEEIQHFEVIMDDEEPIVLSADRTGYLFENLTPNTEYHIEVKLITTDGSQYSDYLYVGTFSEPTLWLDLYTEEVTANSVQLAWDTYGDLTAHHYGIFVDGQLHGNTFDNTYTVDGLTSGTEYEIRVAALDPEGNVIDQAYLYVTPYGEDNGAGEGDPITFQDNILEEEIRFQLDIYDRPVTTGDMESLTTFYAPNKGITALEGLQYAVNMESLEIPHNAIEDVTPIANLTKLTHLSIWDNNISDISALELLTNLSYLDMDTNNISDITPLKDMQKLETLWLKDNPITDVSLLLDLPALTEVYLTGIQVDFSQGSEGLEIIQALMERGVMVSYDGQIEEVEFYGYEYLITETEIGLEWWTNLPTEEIDRFEVNVDGGEPTVLSAETNTLLLQDLQPATTYQVEFTMFTQSGTAYTATREVTTMQTPENYEDVTLVAKDSKSLTGVQGLYYAISGVEPATYNQYHYGYTNANGTFRDYNSPSGVHKLPAGTYEVTLYGHHDYVEDIFVINVTKDGDYIANPIEILVEKIEMDTADVQVKVTDKAGNPVTNLEYISLYSSKMVSQFGYDHGYYTDWSLSSENGVYSLGTLAASDDYNLSLQATDYKMHDEYNITLLEGSNTLQVELTEGAKVTGKIVDANDNPLLGASYYAYGNTSYAYGQTKSEGEMTLAGITVEDMTLEISMPGYQTKQLSIKATDFDGETLNLGNIVMSPEQYVHGKVLNEKGEPVRQAYVYLYEEGASWSSYWARTDATGYFKVRNVEGDTTYTLKTEAYNQPQAVKEVTASTDEYTIILEKPATGSFVGEGNSISTNKQTVTAGSQVEYRINYKNNGNAKAENVKIDFTLPAGVTLIEESILASKKDGSTIDSTTVTITEVSAGETGTVSFKATVDASYQAANFVTTASITAGEDQTNLSATTSVNFVTMTAPEATASSTVKVYGAAKAGSEVEIYDGNVLVGQTTAQGRYWYADVQLQTTAGEDSEHILTAKVKNGDQTAYSSPVTVKYIPAIPTVTDVTIDAGWNQDIKLDPNTGVATFAIVEFTPIDVEIAFDMDIEKGKIHFLGEEYALEKSGDVYTTNIPGTWSSYGEQMFELEYTVGKNTIRLPLMEVIVLIDPSGYVFEGSMDNRLSGVTAEVFERDRNFDEIWRTWNAAFFGGQVNPQITDKDGRYGWDVPEGFWKVIWTKEGYHTYESRMVEVPPAETELNVPMVRNYDPVLETITPTDSTQDVALDSSITVEFDRLMNESNIQDFIKVYNTKDNTEVEGTFTLEGYNGYRETTPYSGYFEENESIKLSKTFVWKPTNNFEAGTEYRVEVSAQLADYDGKVLGETQTSTIQTVAAEEEPGDGTEEPGDGTEEPGDGTEEPGDENEEPGDSNVEPGDNNEQPGTTPGKQPTDKDKAPAKDKDKNKDKTKADKDVKKEEDKEQKGSKLPNTSTLLYNYLLLGTLLTIAGALFLLANRRRNA